MKTSFEIPRVRVVDGGLHGARCKTRLPFRFGIATLTEATLCHARVVVESSDHRRVEGFSSDLLVPKWFRKNPAATMEEDTAELHESARAALEALLGRDESTSVFDHWHGLYQTRVTPHESDADEALVRGFGVSLVERAMMDAVCRLQGVSFFQAVKNNLFGFAPDLLDPGLAGFCLENHLPETPLRSLTVRHTIGLLDRLRVTDEGDRAGDGFPECLEEDIRTYGLHAFKIKVSGDGEKDLSRLVGVAQVLRELVPESPRITLDGNEQFESLDGLIDLLSRLKEYPDGKWLLSNLLYIEQPVSRKYTFDVDRHRALSELNRFAPLLLDEADVGLSSFPRAIEVGYRGVSVKNCKGVFRALLNFSRCACSEGKRDGLFQSSEDLTNLPVLALQQDLATAAALGLTHSERNGHHYFRGLSHLSHDEARVALKCHSDLYQEDEDGGVSLRIQDGRLTLDSIHVEGYGYGVPISVEKRTA